MQDNLLDPFTPLYEEMLDLTIILENMAPFVNKMREEQIAELDMMHNRMLDLNLMFGWFE